MISFPILVLFQLKRHKGGLALMKKEPETNNVGACHTIYFVFIALNYGLLIEVIVVSSSQMKTN